MANQRDPLKVFTPTREASSQVRDGVVPQVKSMNTSQSGPKDGAPIQGHRNEPRGA